MVEFSHRERKDCVLRLIKKNFLIKFIVCFLWDAISLD